MSECQYMTGEALPFGTKVEAQKLIGKEVDYLLHGGIDKSGRGYIFPRTDVVKGVLGKHIEFENAGYIHRRSIAEIKLAGTKNGDSHVQHRR